MMVEARELALSMDLRDGVGEELLSPEVFHCGKTGKFTAILSLIISIILLTIFAQTSRFGMQSKWDVT